MDKETLQRFKSKVSISQQSNCWIWTDRPSQKGYGRLLVDGKVMQAHRLSYEHFVGPLNPWLTIDHLCRVRLCVNPNHLEQVTSKENSLRGVGVTANFARATHCKRGHPKVKENLYIKKDGTVRCKICSWGGEKVRRARLREDHK